MCFRKKNNSSNYGGASVAKTNSIVVSGETKNTITRKKNICITQSSSDVLRRINKACASLAPPRHHTIC